MSLSRHLQTSGLFDTITGMSYQSLREVVVDLGTAWYADHPEERDIIAANLDAFELDTSPATIDAVQYNTILHYYEKFLPLAGSIQTYAEFLKNHIDAGDAIEIVQKSIAASRGVCLATAHFGAVEFIVPFLAAHHLPMNCVLKFSTEALSTIAHQQSAGLEKSGLFSLINLIEIGKPKTIAALQMAAVLRRKEIILSVFDEKTPYSKPVELFGTQVWGGAGLDRMIAFANTPVDLYAAFMVRRDADRYRLELHRIDAAETDCISAIYRVLESVVKQHPAQWYFLHEKLPFVLEAVT
jgi:lauroyl/myristoyl acyltransferase